MEKSEDLEKAFAGAYGVFAGELDVLKKKKNKTLSKIDLVTNMDPGNPPLAEFNQGKRIVEAAAKSKVQHFIYRRVWRLFASTALKKTIKFISAPLMTSKKLIQP